MNVIQYAVLRLITTPPALRMRSAPGRHDRRAEYHIQRRILLEGLADFLKQRLPLLAGYKFVVVVSHIHPLQFVIGIVHTLAIFNDWW